MIPIMVAVPSYVSANARRALDNIDRKGDGVTDKTLRETRQLAAGNASENKVMRMAAWFARHKRISILRKLPHIYVVTAR